MPPDEKTKNRILITGGAGYIGGVLTDLLIEEGYAVTVYDNLTYEGRFLKPVTFVFGDVRDRAKLARVLKENKYDAVVWLAALVGDGACAINPERATEINVSSIAWLTENFDGKIIFMSTCSVYGANTALLNEDSPLNPLSHYADTKLAAENVLRERSPNSLTYRLGTLYGLGDAHARLRLDLVVNVLAKKAACREPLTVFGGGQWRPLLHVRDVSEAILFGLKRGLTGLYNVVNKNYMVYEVADEIAAIIPDTKIVYGNLPFEDLRNYKVSNDRIRSLGWQPRYELTSGIDEIHRAIKEGRVKQPDDIVYSNAEYLKNRLI